MSASGGYELTKFQTGSADTEGQNIIEQNRIGDILSLKRID